jgi:hypothetical protein
LADASKDIARFTGAHEQAEIVWNRGEVGYHVLNAISIAEIENIICAEERRLLKMRWHTLLTPAKWLNDYTVIGITRKMLNWQWLLNELGYVSASYTKLNFKAKATLKKFIRQPVEEQVSFLLDRAPESLAEARKQLSWSGACIAFRDTIALRPSECAIGNTAEWIGRFCSLLNCPPLQMPRGYLFGVAFELRARQLLLLSQISVSAWLTFRGHVGTYGAIKTSFEDPYTLELVERYAAMERPYWDVASSEAGDNFSENTTKRIKARIADLILATTVKDLRREVNWEFAKAFALPASRAMSSSGITKMLREFALKNVGPEVLAIYRKTKSGSGGGVSITKVPSWTFLNPILGHIPEDRKPEFSNWLNLFERYGDSLSVKLPGSISNALTHFVKWLVANEEFISPLKFTRAAFRSDTDSERLTFRRYLENSLPNVGFRNDVLSYLNRFFDWLSQEIPAFKNPIVYRLDRFKTAGGGLGRGKTVRGRIESRVLDDLKNFLIVRTEQGFQWSVWVKEQELLRVDGQLVFCPLLPAIIAFLLRWPLRSNQVLWLDSGELDEERFDFSTRKFVRNPNGVKGRAMGAIAASSDGLFGEEQQLDLQVAVNKRPVGTRSDYTIPYMDEETIWIISEVLAFQERFGLPPRLVKESYNSGGRVNPRVSAMLPDLCCLFRDRGGKGYLPPDSWALNRYWAKVCEAYDRQNAQWPHPQTGVLGPRPNWPVLSRRTEKDYIVSGAQLRSGIQGPRHKITAKRVRARYDIHSLRVSGVSYLLDRGIPLGVVAAIAGHACLIMTLHYERAEIRKKMSELLRQNPEFASEALRVEERLRKGGNLSSWLRCLTDAGPSLLSERLSNGGPYQIRTTGICPGTDCASGLAVRAKLLSDDRSLTAVPGSYCSLCVYNLYGVPFLPGLVREFNETLYVLEQRARKQLELRERERNCEAAARFDEASILRGEDELLARRSEADCAHMVRLYEMIQECLLMTSEPAENEEAKPGLVILGGTRAIVERSGTFEQMKEILDVNELLPSTQSSVPDQVAPVFQNRLLSMLARNGIEPYLLGLPTKIAKTASLALADILVRSVPKREDIESVFSGQRLIRDLGPAVESSILDSVRAMSARLKGASGKEIEGAVGQLQLLL